MRKISIGTMIIGIFIPLITGGISAAISSEAMIAYEIMQKPYLSPPAWVFSVVWPILYIMMGLASYLVFVSDGDFTKKVIAMLLYFLQLAMNFTWSIIFFNKDMHLVAFQWLIIMLCIVIICAYRFYFINKTAAYLRPIVSDTIL